jgi:glycyl-tRNA synthetase beta chain
VREPQTLPLLVEIGCEEIPARFLDGARDDFGKALLEALEEARLLPSQSRTGKWYSTPRRLTVWVPSVLARQPDRVEETVGPPVKVAFDEAGNPTRAAESFAAKNNVPLQDLVRVTMPKGEYLAARKTLRGRRTIEVLAQIIPGVVTGLSFPKSMYWVEKAGPRFIRPIRWILALLGEGPQGRVVPFKIGGVKSSSVTYGHRAYTRKPIRVRSFTEYEKKLRQGHVEFDPERRLAALRQKSKVLLEGKLRRVEDPDLERWVVNSTEWPSAMRGSFQARFLHLPREILITVMRDHQKYFAVEDSRGKLQPFFVALLNLDRDARGLIRRGHEGVLAARFADAEFFWSSDQKVPLAERTERLARVTYQAQLGSYADKVERMRQIGRHIVQALADMGKITHAEAEHALRAIELCKCDLTTQMVQEFTELQGVVGGLYAAAQGEPREVAEAIYDHYKPEGLEDRCPRSLAGAVASLADKVDSVAGGFAAGQEPTGSSDPFALRRQGNGIVKVLVEDSIHLPLRPLVGVALNNLTVDWKRPQHEVFGAVVAFLEERLRYYLESVRELRYDTVRAVLAAGSDIPLDAVRRAEALEGLRGSEDLEALCAAAKRIKNILAKSASASDWAPGEVDAALLEAGPERKLVQAYEQSATRARELAETGEYRKALEAIAGLRPAVDKFFDKVLVMAEDRTVRQNRLRLLGRLDELFSGIALFAEIAAGEKAASGVRD